jgi:TolB-like protein/tetratricopeptide (TPR) repeat protein
MTVYEFAGFCLDESRRILLDRDGAAVALTPKAYETLAYLVKHSGTVLDKEQMIRAIWPDTAVEENNLTQNISLLRRVLGEERGEHRFIATVPGRGYHFVAPVTVEGKADLRQGSAETVSIAVLPFTNNSADAEYDYFADGLADELINALSRVTGVRVAARMSAFSFKGKQAHIREIASLLGVAFVLEGSVRKSDCRLRITAHVVNVADGYQLWSERYEREIGSRNLFDVQDEITVAVVNALRLKLPCQPGMSGRRVAGNPLAHELYLKGRFHLFQMTETGIQAGIGYFEKAIEADPGYAPAHVGLAHAYRMFGLSLEKPANEAGPKSKTAALQAVAIDDTLAEAHAVLAFTTFWYDREWRLAEQHFKRAIALNPDSADTYWMYAHVPSNLGRHGEALAMAARARELDPLSGLIHAMEGQVLLHAGRLGDSVARLKEATELDPRSRVAHLFASSAYIALGRLEDAIDEARIAHDLCPANSSARANEAYAHAKAGRQSEACQMLAELMDRAANRYVPNSNIALICNALGRTGEALTWLERAVEQHDPWLAFLGVDPKWKNLRDHPRYLTLLRRLNLPTA